MYQHKRWDRLNKLCWEGFDMVLKYAKDKYPSDSQNESLNKMIGNYEGDWDVFITTLTKQEN